MKPAAISICNPPSQWSHTGTRYVRKQNNCGVTQNLLRSRSDYFVTTEKTREQHERRTPQKEYNCSPTPAVRKQGGRIHRFVSSSLIKPSLFLGQYLFPTEAVPVSGRSFERKNLGLDECHLEHSVLVVVLFAARAIRLAGAFVLFMWSIRLSRIH